MQVQGKGRILRGAPKIAGVIREILDDPSIKESWVYDQAAKKRIPVFKDGATLIAMDTVLVEHYERLATGTTRAG